MIEVNSNALFLSTFGVKIDVKNERKRVSRMCENVYLSIKNPKASRAHLRALDPGHRLLTSLERLCFATSAIFSLRSWGSPLDQILDPHLFYDNLATRRMTSPVTHEGNLSPHFSPTCTGVASTLKKLGQVRNLTEFEVNCATCSTYS